MQFEIVKAADGTEVVMRSETHRVTRPKRVPLPAAPDMSADEIRARRDAAVERLRAVEREIGALETLLALKKRQ